MDILEAFRGYLLKNRQTSSQITVKNYLADVRAFIRWYEDTFKTEFLPELIKSSIINQYRNESRLSIRTLDRHFSSLRKFYKFLEAEHGVISSPFLVSEKKVVSDPWKLKEFKDYLYLNKSSYLTIKNYLNDILGFKKWCTEIFPNESSEAVILSYVQESLVEEYKQRLLEILDLSPSTINRKLSSIRKYIEFARNQKILAERTHYDNQRIENFETLQEVIEKSQDYHHGGIFGLYQRLENKLAEGISNLLLSFGERNSESSVGNLSKSFYAPHKISTLHFPWHKKAIFHAKHTRPEWYRRYHMYTFSHYLHLAFLFIFCIGIGIYLYAAVLANPSATQPLVAEAASPPKTLIFRGKLLDQQNRPITSGQDLRFAIYNSPTASGSALLWQEVQNNIKTDQNGIFSTVLGLSIPIPSNLINKTDGLYVGITIGTGDELLPRQRLGGVSFAQSSDLLSGLPVITRSGSSDRNVVVALDSSGNLIIGGVADHSIQVSGGTLSLLGQSLNLSTNPSSNGDIALSPDGFGEIDIQKPIKNSGTYSNITDGNGNYPTQGSVEFDDTVAILATSSAQAAFTIEQEGFGPLIAASTSGSPKFTVDYNGAITTGSWQAAPIPLRFGGTGGDLSEAVPGSLVFIGTQSALMTVSPGQPGTILTSNGSGAAPSWTTLNDLKNSPWTVNGDLLSPQTSTSDLALGGNSTSSARFAVTNMGGTGTPTLFLKNPSNGNGIVLSSEGSLQTLQNNPLIMGGNTTGAVFFKPGNITSLALNTSGNVGVGTSNPVFKLDIQDNQISTVAASIYNSNSGSNADGLLIKLGNNTQNVSENNHFISFETDGIGVVGSIEGNNADGIKFQTSGIADFAEYLSKNPSDSIPFGSLLCLDQSGDVRACLGAHDAVIGVASEHPTFVGGENRGIASIAVGMIGQIKVRVSTENGIIQPGDLITTSLIAGVGAKATYAGKVIGRALQEYDGPIGTIGEILVAVEPSWYDPGTEMTDTGKLSFVSQQAETPDFPTAQPENPLFSLVTTGGSVIHSIGVFSEAVIGNLRAGAIQAERITTKGLAVTTESLTIGGKTLKDYISQVVADTNRGIAQAEGNQTEIKTALISPLQNSNNITINLGDATKSGTLQIVSAGKAVAQIDNTGNATFSGSISASTASISGNLTATDASVSGTLHAGKIIASEIDGLGDQIAAIASQSAKPSEFATVANSQPNPESFSGVNIGSISADFAMVKNGLVSLGPASMADVSVANTLSVNNSLFFAENAINTLGSDLEIQPLGQGGISFLAGKVRIDVDGNVSFAENATFAKNVSVNGTLSAGIISPLGDNSLSIALGSKTNGKQSLIIQDANGQSVASIDQKGNIVASGSASFAGDLVASGAALLKKINIFSSPVYALSDSESIATGSAGIGKLKAYHTEMTLDNTEVTDHSLIYITPIGDTGGQIVSLLRQRPGTSFTVGVEEPIQHDIQFNWIIIN